MFFIYRNLVVEIIPNAKCCNYEDKATLSIGEEYLDAEVSSLNFLLYIVISCIKFDYCNRHLLVFSFM